MILSLFRKDPSREAAGPLFPAAVEQARRPVFYRDFAVADTVEGRFEMLSLHVWLVMRRLKGAQTGRLSRQGLEAYFSNLDGALREMGVGDLVVGKKIRALGEAFYGRIGAYDRALGEGGNAESLAAALSRNIFEAIDAPTAPALARYVSVADKALLEQSLARISAGVIRFPEPDTAAQTAQAGDV